MEGKVGDYLKHTREEARDKYMQSLNIIVFNDK